MHNHARLHERQLGDAIKKGGKAFVSAITELFDPEAQTVVSVIYVTASPTFDGPIGGYKTLGVDDEDEDTKTTSTIQRPKTVESTTTTAKKETVQSTLVVDTETSTRRQTTLRTSTSTALPSEISAPTSALTSLAAVVVATGSATRTSSRATKTPTLDSSASESSSTAVPTSSGMSTGGKAGLAIGILLLVGAILAIALFVFKKRKDKAKKEQQQLEDEKSAMFAASGRAASTRTNATAPQLSLRPVTQFLPNLGAKRASQGNVLNTMANATPNRQVTPPEQNRNNPFGNSAEVIDGPNANSSSPVQINGPSGEVLVAGAALATPVGLTRGASKRVNGASPMDYTTKNSAFMGPPSPSGTEFSQNSDAAYTPTPSGTGAAIAAAGGPANTAVHRVQLDFKPSMEDELELRAGQLVRVLHEYDDGWALCIRLDRSQQGVAPRTCLSARPVKPRPQQQQRISPQGQRGPQGQMRNGSPGMNGPPRGSPPNGQGPRSASPPSGRNSPGPQYNAQRPNTPQGQGRPMTPQGQGRPMTPQGQAPQQAQRSSPTSSPMNSQPNYTQPMSSSPPSNFGAPVGRKPVPGQAM